ALTAGRPFLGGPRRCRARVKRLAQVPAQWKIPMVERSPYLTAFSHLIMVLGIIIVGFPLYLAFVASTHTAVDIVRQVPMPMVPGNNFWQTYHDTLFGGGSGPGSTAPVARMMW